MGLVSVAVVSTILFACHPPKPASRGGARGYPVSSMVTDPVSGFTDPGSADQVALAFASEALGTGIYAAIVLFKDGTLAVNDDGVRRTGRLAPAQVQSLVDEVTAHLQAPELIATQNYEIDHGQISVIGFRVGPRWFSVDHYPWFTSSFKEVAAEPQPTAATHCENVDSFCESPAPWHFAKAIVAIYAAIPARTTAPAPVQYRVTFWADDQPGGRNDFAWPRDVLLPQLPPSEKCSAWEGGGCPVDIAPANYARIEALAVRLKKRDNIARTVIDGKRWLVTINPVFLGDREVAALLWKNLTGNKANSERDGASGTTKSDRAD